MEFCKDLLDVVSVPRFALETLLQKNESSIRVYLYGLVRGSAAPEQMAGELSLSRAQVLEALEQLEAALADAQKQTVSTLIDIKVLPKTMIHKYFSWWRVGGAQVSNSERVDAVARMLNQHIDQAREY